jgi:HEAT repeat protein
MPAVPVLGRTLSHQISNLRKEAALALGEIRVAAALPALERIQNDPDPYVRKAARLAID